jgi:hypothetical protein
MLEAAVAVPVVVAEGLVALVVLAGVQMEALPSPLAPRQPPILAVAAEAEVLVLLQMELVALAVLVL